MIITAQSRNKSANLNESEAITIKVPENTDFETVFRRLMYTYGQVTDTDKIDAKTKRYTFLAKMQYRDTLESYDLETSVTVER